MPSPVLLITYCIVLFMANGRVLTIITSPCRPDPGGPCREGAGDRAAPEVLTSPLRPQLVEGILQKLVASLSNLCFSSLLPLQCRRSRPSIMGFLWSSWLILPGPTTCQWNTAHGQIPKTCLQPYEKEMGENLRSCNSCHSLEINISFFGECRRKQPPDAALQKNIA